MITNVDFASLYGVAQSLTTKEPSVWALGSYYDVAATLLQTDHVRVPPPSTAAQTHRLIVHPIQRRFGTHTTFREKDIAQALEYSREIDTNTTSTIRRNLKLWLGSSAYEQWLQWHVEMEWKGHIEHLPGLVEPANILWIAKILDKSTDDLTELNIEALRDTDKVCSNPKDLQKLMYTVDSVLRGLYYDKLAQLAGRRVILHPIRRAILPPGGSAVQYPEPVAPYLTAIVGNWAGKQRLSEDKTVEVWTKMLLECRTFYKDWRKRSVKEPITDPKAVAVAIAKQAGVTYPLRFRRVWERVFETGVALATGIALEIYLDRSGVPPGPRKWLTDLTGVGTGFLAADLALSRPLETLGKAPWAIGRLADKGKWFSGRVFSYKEAAIGAL